MAAFVGDPREPTVSPLRSGGCDVLIHISDRGSFEDEFENKRVCNELEAVFPRLQLVIAYPSNEQPIADSSSNSKSGLCRIVVYRHENVTTGIQQVRSTLEYRSALLLSQALDAKACVLLASGDELQSPDSIAALAHPVLTDQFDLSVSAYQTNAFDGMVNSGILYPLSRVICGSYIRYPLAPDVAISASARSFLLEQRLRNVTDQSLSHILWPAMDLALRGFKVGQVAVGPRIQFSPGGPSLGDLITEVVGALFSEIELKASMWQRNLTLPVDVSQVCERGIETIPPDPLPLVESFKLGSRNLQEIWRLVLPPHSLLALKRLAQLGSSDFQMPDSLWARIVYDFLLAHRSRTMSRKHLLGALTPLYLGWVASYVMDISRHGQANVEARIEALAKAFEVDRSYLVSQWRWPDRFNP